MITKQTVFILGAGASTFYGFPAGDNLIKCMVEELRWPGSYSKLVQLGGFSDGKTEDLIEEMIFSVNP